MKKLSAFIIVVIVTLLIGSSASFAAASEPYFSNNKALDGIFAKLEKTFLQYPRDEVIPLEELIPIGTDEDEKNIKPQPTKKITDAQVKTAAEKQLNYIKVAVEIKEEELGGLSQQEYNKISDFLTDKLFFTRNSDYGWDYAGKLVSLYLSLAADEDMVDFKGLEGNLARMGKEKDQVDQADLQVKDKIVRYLNQSIQKGNKVSPEIMDKLPGEVEKLFNESGLSKIIAARVLADIHRDIYHFNTSDINNLYDGSQSIEEILESYKASIELTQMYREDEEKEEYYEYASDTPSKNFYESITHRIVNGDLSEDFTHGFKNPITLGELAKLYFEKREVNEKIVIDDNTIANSPDYIKNAFIYGLIDDGNNLEKPLTRLEAARRLVSSTMYMNGIISTLKVTDCAKIPVADQVAVGSCLKGGMGTRIDKFEPDSGYTKEEAIMDNSPFLFSGVLRGYNLPLSLDEPSKIIIGKNSINLLFQNKDEIEQYIEENFMDTPLSEIKTNGSYVKIDTGCALIELFTPENGIKFTIKNGAKYIDFSEGAYGPDLEYKIEPKVVKNTEKVDMNMQPDSRYKKLNPKLDAILAKIIKPGMTQEQKVKAIHDYVVLHVTYDSRLQDEQTIESVIETIDKGRGVCGDYVLLFLHLCRRASIPCAYEAGDPYVFNHAWNAVFVNGQWLFVDTTWDDKDNGKILYTYYLKDRFTFMNTHTPFMGSPDPKVYTDIDKMNIKTQDELRAYLLQNFYWIDGFKLTFRLADKNFKPSVGYLNDPYVNIALTYDSKNNLYTVTAKGKGKK